MAELFALFPEGWAGAEANGAVVRRARLQPKRRQAPIEAIERQGEAVLVRLAARPMQQWSLFEAAAFAMTLQDLAGRQGVGSIVLIGDAAFDSPQADPQVASTVVAAVTDCPAAVFAAVEGRAVGVGLELALACAGRVATGGAQFAAPAVLAGRLPIHGGVERLLALIGEDAAARLIVFGETIDAVAALRVGLIDGMVARGAATLAMAMAQSRDRSVESTSHRPLPRRSSGELPSIRVQLQRRAPGQAAPLAAVQAMEAAIQLPARRAAAEIHAIAARLEATDHARALRHAAAAEAAWRDRSDEDAARSMALAWPMRREAIHLVDEGASAAQIDRVLLHYGFARAVFAEANRLGFAAVFSADGETVASDRAWPVYSPTLDFMVDAGRAGGAQPGWFRPRGEEPWGDPEVERIVAASAVFRRVTRARPTDDRVERRLVQAMIAGSVELLAACPELGWTDTDAIWTQELDFPRWRGGPLFQGAKVGWAQVAAEFESAGCRRTLGPLNARLARWAVGDGEPPTLD